jgi:hypothetical protein
MPNSKSKIVIIEKKEGSSNWVKQKNMKI